MPLLPLEPFVFPDDLLSQRRAAPTLESGPRWWVLHTKPRAEKALSRKLLNRTVPFFLPLHKRQWRNRGRLHASYLPLFPSYLFLLAEHEVVARTLETNLIARVLPVDDQKQLHADLTRVYSLIASGAALAPEDRLEPGSLVEITSGPLAGLEGKVLRKGKQLKFIVEVQFLQRGVSVEVESWMLQPRNVPVARSSESPSASPARVGAS